MDIQYLTHEKIDKHHWDRRVEGCENSLIYAFSHYLDAMSPGWDALVADNYEYIMPLTWRKKYGIHYLYQPFFCAQLGVFGNHISKEIAEDFLMAIPRKFKYWDIYLNPTNYFQLSNFPMYERSNYILSLAPNYETLYGSYSQGHQRNIKRSIKFGNQVKKDISIASIIQLAMNQAETFSPITQNDFRRFEQLLSHLNHQGQVKTYGVFAKDQSLVASAAFLFAKNRAYYILVGNHPNGRTLSASHLLINAFIEDHAGSGLVLDFEGSSISSLGYFYKSFGASLEIFPGLKVNRLPQLLRLLRK